MFKLGQKLRDRVTGLEGIAVQRIEYLNGCVQYAIKPKAKKGDVTLPDGWCIDQQQLEVVDEGLNKSKPVEKKKTGGPETRLKSQRA